ncbi:phosphopantetheine-binding protein [Streptomyces nigra]
MQHTFTMYPGMDDAQLDRGDLARFDAEGLLHYEGRDDAQIKVAGHRLELGQVEAALLQYPGVVNAVTAMADGRLVAALECRGEDPDPGGLAEHLTALLPVHVRVARFRRVTALPRTPSGKADRRATLTAPGHDLRDAEPSDVGLSPLEGRLTTLFEEVTGITVGVGQRYFDAGATSLGLMRFQLACAGEDGLSFSVPDLFEHVTLRALARFLEERRAVREAADVAIRPAPEAADEPVAVIGMAVRLPGAPDLAAFWDLVASGRPRHRGLPRGGRPRRCPQPDGRDPRLRPGPFHPQPG